MINSFKLKPALLITLCFIALGAMLSTDLYAQNLIIKPKQIRKPVRQNVSRVYHNPILPGDFQNTDVIRVRDTYYYISATKELSPGMMILSSRNLVDWKIIGHAVTDITQISPRYSYDKMDGQGRGIWAGAIRYHNNKLYVYFTDPDEGLFVTTADDPAGTWAPLKALKKEPGWDDPCPLWDDDGKAYLVMTHFADNYKIYVFGLSQDGKALTDSGKVIYQGKGSEANKLYKINNYYYHFYSEVTKEGRMPFMERAKNIYGPYHERHQLIHKARAEPNQGGLVSTVAGKWYFVTHHGQSYWSGREASLLPVTWINGWPVWGRAGKDGIGNMVWSGVRPAGKAKALQTSDEFDRKVISPQWEWYFQPDDKKWSLQERPGYLRLYASKPIVAGDITKISTMLTQRPLRVHHNMIVSKINIANMADGQIAGLALFGKTFSCIGIAQNQNNRNFYFNNTGTIAKGVIINNKIANIWLKAIWNIEGKTSFYFSTDGVKFISLGPNYQITNFGNYLGAKIGLYSSNRKINQGFVDVDWFHYKYW